MSAFILELGFCFFGVGRGKDGTDQLVPMNASKRSMAAYKDLPLEVGCAAM